MLEDTHVCESGDWGWELLRTEVDIAQIMLIY
jgi:hypothetical protein